MTQFLKNAALLLAGVAGGWWLHGTTYTAGPAPELFVDPGPMAEVSVLVPAEVPTSRGNGYTRTTPVVETPVPPTAAAFRQLLKQRDFEQALAYYEQALLLDDRYQGLLKPVLEHYLQTCLQQCHDGVFVDLVELWLGTYYQDIAVLLLLAEHQRAQGLPEVAAGTLKMAATYAMQAGQQEQVDAAVQRLVQATDTLLSRQQRWIELLGFYEYLEAIDLGQRDFLQRQAAVSQQLVEPDNGGGAQQSIPLDRRGDHFLVAIELNDADLVTLMIDTGASVTTLTSTSFSLLSSSDYEYRGSHVFNTANGLAPGEVYRTGSIRLGDSRIEDVDVAVLDYRPSEGVDGVLGMNVLRNYRFEIDQDRELLLLRPRQR